MSGRRTVAQDNPPLRLLTLIAAAFAFWRVGEDGSEFGILLFWLCAIILTGLLACAALSPR